MYIIPQHNAETVSFGSQRTNFSQIWIKIRISLGKKMQLKLSSANKATILSGLEVLIFTPLPAGPITVYITHYPFNTPQNKVNAVTKRNICIYRTYNLHQ